MSKIARTTVAVALAIATVPAVAGAEPRAMKPWMPAGTAPPWTTTATTSEPTPAATPAAVSAAPPSRSEAMAAVAAPDAKTSNQAGAAPLQGTTTPIHAVSLRAGPYAGATIIGTLKPGMPLRVLASANHGWIQVESADGSGWAYGTYLAPTRSTDGTQRQVSPQ
jgi:SH3 domain-containing protein